jgi:hypothetical protein
MQCSRSFVYPSRYCWSLVCDVMQCTNNPTPCRQVATCRSSWGKFDQVAVGAQVRRVIL